MGDRQHVLPERSGQGARIGIGVAGDDVGDSGESVRRAAEFHVQLRMLRERKLLSTPAVDPGRHRCAGGEIGFGAARGETLRRDPVHDPVEGRGRVVGTWLGFATETVHPPPKLRRAEKPDVPLHRFEHLDERRELGVVSRYALVVGNHAEPGQRPPGRCHAFVDIRGLGLCAVPESFRDRRHAAPHPRVEQAVGDQLRPEARLAAKNPARRSRG